MQALTNIRSFLAQLRRRLRVLVVVRDTGVFVAVVGLLLLLLAIVTSLLDYRTPLRTLALLLALPVIVGFGIHLVLAIRRVRDDRALARLVGLRFPSLHSDLLSTVELGQQICDESTRFSRELYNALASQTWRRLGRLTVRALVPPALLKPSAVLLTLCVLAWATTAATVPHHIRRGAGRLLSSGFVADGEIAPALLVGDLSLTFVYPPHMGRPGRVVQSSTGHITAPRGTRVAIEATALAPVTEPAALVVRRRGEKTERLALSLSDHRLRGRLTVAGDGSYRFQVHTPDGRLMQDPIVRRIHVEPDALPRVTLYGPLSDLSVTTRHHLEVGYTAEDDYGLTRIDLVHQLGSTPPRRQVLWREGKAGRKRSAMGRHDWDLAGIDLFPGARVAYWLEAVDNDTVSGPKVGRSSTLYFKVYSADEKHQETIRQQQALVEQAIRVLADRLLLYEQEPATSASLRLTKNLEIGRSHGALVDGLRELRNRMRQDNLVPRALLRSISRMHQRMDLLFRAESTLLRHADAIRRRHPGRPVNLEPLREQNGKLVAEMERDVLLLANLLDEQRLQNLMSLSKEMDLARKRLADLLRRYRKTRSEELRRQLLRQIARMQQQVAELMSRMAKLGRSLPDEYLNSEALRDLDLASELRKLSQQIQSGKLDRLDEALRALEQKLAQLDGMLADDLSRFRQGRMSARERAYAAMLDRLRGLESEQRQIAERTKRVIRRYHQRAAKLMKNKINPFVRRELSKLNRLKKRVNEIEGAMLAPYDQEQLERIRQRVRDLEGMLDQGDLDEALRMALRTRNGLQVLQDDLSEEMEGQPPRRRARMGRSLRKARAARKLADELVADLRGIFPHPRSLLDANDRGELNRQLRRQRNLRRKSQQLGSQLEKQPRSLFGSEPPMVIKEAAGLMGQAGDKLRGLQPQEAHSSQEAAADRLAQLRRQMEQARQPHQWSQAGPSVLRERIHIPGADAFRPPKEFRQDILDAMKEKAPQTFEGQVQRYYEELVR